MYVKLWDMTKSTSLWHKCGKKIYSANCDIEIKRALTLFLVGGGYHSPPISKSLAKPNLKDQQPPVMIDNSYIGLL